MLTTQFHCRLFADYFQFYIEDENSGSALGDS